MESVPGNGYTANFHNLDLAELAQQPEWKVMLMDVVQKEKMDPWNVDITLLTEKFMENLRSMKQFNFRVPANAVLASSILLRFKSDAWTIHAILDDNLIYIPDEVLSEPIFPTIEPMLRVTKRKVSIDELIEAIDDIIVKEKKGAEKKRMPLNDIPAPLIELMKQDGVSFEKKLEDIYAKMKVTADKENLTLFSNLLVKKDADEVIENFIPMLHLANSRKIDVWQDTVFGEIFIQLHNGVVDAEVNGEKASVAE